MLNLGLFFLFAPIAAIELLFYRQFSVLLVGGLYFALAAQADYASSRLMARGLYPQAKEGRRRRHWSEDEPAGEDEELVVQELPRRRWKAAEAPRAAFVPPPQPVLPPPASEPPRPRPRVRPHPESRHEHVKALPAAPKFHGRAHEVLGVHENAKTRTIVSAFRHWIKQFHPDRAAGLPAEAANAKVQQLTEAKEHLLERRKSGRRKAA